MRRRLVAAAALLALAVPAAAYVPSAGRVVESVAKTNVRSERTRGLRLELELRGDDGRVEAAGTAWLDPSGVVRLSLREPDGDVEEHELVAGTHRAARNGRPLSSPRPLLPPWEVLQAESGSELRGMLYRLGVDPDYVELGYEGAHDCYVIGGRARAREGRAPVRAALWVDVESLDPVRVDRADGVRFRLGPPLAAGRIRFPSWIEAATPRGDRWRLVVKSVQPGGLPPAAGASSTR